jgi:hypothetical protein
MNAFLRGLGSDETVGPFAIYTQICRASTHESRAAYGMQILPSCFFARRLYTKLTPVWPSLKCAARR